MVAPEYFLHLYGSGEFHVRMKYRDIQSGQGEQQKGSDKKYPETTRPNYIARIYLTLTILK